VTSAFFLPVEPGHRFCIYHAPVHGSAPRGGIVYVHPFAEEMNKARRMAALQARRLAAAGYGVLQIDLLGCGDSSGEFADARWQLWKQDVLAGLEWVKTRVNGPLGLWGLRLGATLASDIAREPGTGAELLALWQPVAVGEQFLTQFLRLYLAAEMLGSGAAQTGVRELREKLACGAALEIAGYELHPDLASVIESLKLADLIPAVRMVAWQEVTVQPEPRLTPASQRVVDAWKAKGVDVRTSVVSGDPFWSTLEIAECEALLDATDAAISHK
jgi:exosortase A-associated hydrolase 2